MEPPPVSQSGARPKTARRVVLSILTGFAVLVLAGIAALVVMRINLSRGNERQLAAIRREGMPASSVELDAWYQAVPDAENAALIFLQAAQRITPLEDGRTNAMASFKYPSVGQPIAASDLEWMQAYVAQNREVLQFARTGLALTHSRYPVNLKPGLVALLSHLSQIKALGQAARYETESAAQSGEPEEALAGIELIFGLGRSLENEPVLISFLVRLALLQIGDSALERALNAASFTDAQLARVDGLLAEADRTNLLVRALAGERAMVLPMYRMTGAELRRIMNAGGPVTGPPGSAEALVQDLGLSGIRSTGFFERDMRFYLGAMRTNIAFARLGPPRSIVLNGLMEQQCQAARKRYYIFSAMLLPGLSRAATKEAAGLASLRLARTGVAIERFRLANGRLPEKLQDLVPRFLPMVLEDPFDGAPVRFKLSGKGYLLYSVADDLQDDGGKERVTGANRYSDKSNYDITFKVLR